MIFDDAFSKEPLGPAVRDGDDEWASAVNWAVIATIQAEEFGITSENVEQMTSSDNPDILRFLGQPVAAEEGAEPEPFDPGLGLEPDFAVDVISSVMPSEKNSCPASPDRLAKGRTAMEMSADGEDSLAAG